MPSRLIAVERAITSAPKSPIYGLVPAPSLSTLQRWVKRYDAAKGSIAGLIGAPSTGRPSKDIVGPIAAHVREEVRSRAAAYRLFGVKGRPKWEALHANVKGFAQGRALPVPTKHAVMRFVRAIHPAEGVIAALGTKAARARVARKAMHPTDAAHELLFGDEVMLPTWIRVWLEEESRWVAARAWAFFVLDKHTRGILAHWVKEPDASTASRLLHTHLTADEIVAVVASVVLPELAHPSDLTFARGAPRELRVDGSGNTKAAAKRLTEARVMTTTRGEAHAPWPRGPIERYFQTLKERDLFELTGDRATHLPFDPDREDPRTTRNRNSADASRAEPYRLEIPVESLGTIAHLRAAVRHAVDTYNATKNRGIQFRTPRSLYEETAPRIDPAAAERSPMAGLFPRTDSRSSRVASRPTTFGTTATISRRRIRRGRTSSYGAIPWGAGSSCTRGASRSAPASRGCSY
jgi:hypothetical protein